MQEAQILRSFAFHPLSCSRLAFCQVSVVDKSKGSVMARCVLPLAEAAQGLMMMDGGSHLTSGDDFAASDQGGRQRSKEGEARVRIQLEHNGLPAGFLSFKMHFKLPDKPSLKPMLGRASVQHGMEAMKRKLVRSSMFFAGHGKFEPPPVAAEASSAGGAKPVTAAGGGSSTGPPKSDSGRVSTGGRSSGEMAALGRLMKTSFTAANAGRQSRGGFGEE